MINSIGNIFIELENKFNIKFGICSIDEVGNLKNRNLLTSDELHIYNSFDNDKRKNEWLAGRIAVKRAFQNFENENDKKITVLNKSDKSPYIVEHPSINVSITHSNQYAIACVSHKKIGVDLEAITHHNQSILKYFFSDSEATKVKSINSKQNKDELITKLWTRKEAISKYLKLGMKLNFRSIDTLEHNFIKKNITNDSILLYSKKINNYYFSVAI